MDDKSLSLDLLHDIVEPAPVSWWPLAPGWYVLGVVVLSLLVVAAVKLWVRWKANAYRRVAIAELADATSVRDVSQLLRRTALASVSRGELATLTEEAWPDWLASRYEAAMPPGVRQTLAGSIYRPHEQEADLSSLKRYAADWIRGHHVPPQSSPARANEVP